MLASIEEQGHGPVMWHAKSYGNTADMLMNSMVMHYSMDNESSNFQGYNVRFKLVRFVTVIQQILPLPWRTKLPSDKFNSI